MYSRDSTTTFQKEKKENGLCSDAMIIFFAAKDGEALHSQEKLDRELTVVHIMNSLLPNSDLH